MLESINRKKQQLLVPPPWKKHLNNYPPPLLVPKKTPSLGLVRSSSAFYPSWHSLYLTDFVGRCPVTLTTHGTMEFISTLKMTSDGPQAHTGRPVGPPTNQPPPFDFCWRGPSPLVPASHQPWPTCRWLPTGSAITWSYVHPPPGDLVGWWVDFRGGWWRMWRMGSGWMFYENRYTF